MKSKTLFYLILLTFLASLIPAMHAQTFSVIHSFTAGAGGKAPFAGVTIRGNTFFGTTSGNDGCGTVYQLTHSGANWLFSTLAATPNDCFPFARVVFGPDSHLYGTSRFGKAYSGGTAFKLAPPVGICRTVACYWPIDDLHVFGSGTDGQGLGNGDLIWDKQGNIYGTTEYGGTYGDGTVYELTPSENGYTETILYNFTGGVDGAGPIGGLVFDNKGNLFGTTPGNVFELSYVPGVGWTEQVLYTFQNFSDGYGSRSTLILDSAGNLYGTNSAGGTSSYGGTLFELSPSGSSWKFKVLYSFYSGQYDWNCGPAAALSMDGEGNIYGTTLCDGAYNWGNVFKLSNTQNGWVYTSLHDFTGATDGGWVASNVSIDTDGTLYGTAAYGANCGGCGTVWMIKP